MYSNLFYISNFNVIGGTETYIYEIAKKYKDKDITVLYKTGDPNQIKRLKKYVRVIKYKGQEIKCKKAFFNYDIDLIDEIQAEEYIQVIHAMYKTNDLTPHTHPKFNKYLAVSKAAADEWEELTGIKPEVCRNVLSISDDENKNVLMLISATRLTYEKGLDRMRILSRLLEDAGIPYLWFIFTDSREKIDSPNVIYLKPTLNIRPYLKMIVGRGYGVQLSTCEGDCYFTRECEAFGLPLICTPIPSFKEQGLEDGKNCYYVPFDMEGIDVYKFLNIPTYKGYIGEDRWDEMLVNIPSYYEKEKNMKVKVKVIVPFSDKYTGELYEENQEITITKERYEEILEVDELVELIEEVKEEPTEELKEIKLEKPKKAKKK